MASTTTDLARARPTRPGPGLLHEIRRNIWPYVFISPFFLMFAVFGLFPYVYAFYLSFLDWDGISPQRFIGLGNYAELLRDDVWWKSLWNSVWLLVVTSINLVIALVLAFLLNSGLIRFKEFWRTAYFTPIVANAVAVTMVFSTLFGLRYGMLNWLLSLVGLGPIDWLGTAVWVKPAIAMVVICR